MKQSSIAMGAVACALLVLSGCGAQQAAETPENMPVPTAAEDMTTRPADGVTPPTSEDMMVEGSSYALVQEESTMEWRGGKITGAEHYGLVDISNAVIMATDEGEITKANFTIDMTTVRSTDNGGNEGLDTHLKGDDFFAVTMYPEARFEMTTIADGVVTGNLTIKDTTQVVSFPATINMEGDRLMATADFSIDRTDFGVTYGSGNFFKEIGDKAINDDMMFTLNIVAEKE
jgi:polyisoprenoid-binding protein YceI